MKEGLDQLTPRRTKMFVVLFMLAAIAAAVYGSFVFKGMIDNEALQEKLDEVRPSNH